MNFHKDYFQSLARVEAFLQKLAPAELTVVIYDYYGSSVDMTDFKERRPWCGVRVAEVSFHNNQGGSSFMQSDLPHGLAFCAQVERCILADLEDWDADGNGDGTEEFERLRYLLKGCAL